MRRIHLLLGWMVWAGVFCAYGVGLFVLGLFRNVGPSRRTDGRRQGVRLLITGRFDSHNWCRSHLIPLARAACVQEIVAVVDGPTVPHPKIRYLRPPAWLTMILGRAASKAIWMLRIISLCRPGVVMGYHLLPGALTALLVAKIARARAVYSMTAGPVELIGGGVGTENALLSRLNGPSPSLERMALRLCRHFDTIVVRGHRAREFLLSRTAAKRVEVIPGSIDPRRFEDTCEVRSYDVAYVGRLQPVKQPDHFLQVMAVLKQTTPDLRAVVVGDGPLMRSLQRKTKTLGLAENVQFVGHLERVEHVLRRTKVFVLTSRSEGLSIALAEAMACRVVPVVADVGDLADLVHNGKTGWRVPPGDFEAYAGRIRSVLEDDSLWRRLSSASRTRACTNNALDAITERWEHFLRAFLPERSDALCEMARLVPHPGDKAGVGGLWVYRPRRSWQGVPRWVKRALARPLEVIPPGYLLGYRYAANARFAERSQRWPAERAEAYQLWRLRRICMLAYERTSFYRRVFEAAGFHPRDLRSIPDLASLPTINRDTLREHLEEMCTVSPRSPGVDYVSTGGTSGAPLHFYIGAGRSEIEYAYLVASWRRAGYRLDMPMAVFRGQVVPADRRGLRHDYDPILRHHCYSNFHMTDENMSRYLQHIRGIGPCFLHVYPSSVAVLARHIRCAGIAPPDNIRGIIAESEIVYPEQRRMVENVFGCRYFSCYGQTEKLVLAAECEYTTDYHVWPTYGCFELLDEEGRSVTTPGERGEIVGTGLINTVVPFIRFRTGDYATYVSDRCEACGREHVIVRDIRGHRTQEFLIAADGSEISWTALNMHDDTFARVRQFQFFQNTPGRTVLRIVPAAGFNDEDRRRIRHNLGRKLDGRVDLALELVDEIPVSPRGKAIYVDQRTRIESDPASSRPWEGR